MSSVTMWKARYTGPFRTGEIVQPLGTKLEAGAHYYGQHHKGFLRCAFCDAGVHHNAGHLSSAGSTKPGRAAHFVTDRGQEHGADCSWIFRDPGQSITEIDPSKGYIIHINTAKSLSADFRESAGDTLEERKAKRGMERIVVNRAQDLTKFIAGADKNRLKDTIVRFQGTDTKWEDFLIRLGTPSRMMKLVERARENPKIPQVCAIEVDITRFYKAHWGRRYDPETKLYKPYVVRPPVKDIDLPLPEERRWEKVRVCIHPDMDGDQSVIDAFPAPGRYLVLGRARITTKGHTHFLNLGLATGRQVTAFDAETLHAEMDRSAERRAGKARIAPSP